MTNNIKLTSEDINLMKARIAFSLNIDDQLAGILLPNPIEVSTESRLFKSTSKEMLSDTDERILRNILNRPLVQDLSDNTPGTREIHTNTTSHNVQPERNSNNMIISNPDSDINLDIELKSNRIEYDSFSKVITTEFDEFTVNEIDLEQISDDLQDELDEVTAERDSYLDRLMEIDPAFGANTRIVENTVATNNLRTTTGTNLESNTIEVQIVPNTTVDEPNDSEPRQNAPTKVTNKANTVKEKEEKTKAIYYGSQYGIVDPDDLRKKVINR